MLSVELGLGLLSIGRKWGVNHVQPPHERDALSLIETAYLNGIRFFDTAPAYGRSETILGYAISKALLPLDQITIATKMGEHWNEDEKSARPGHSFDELAQILDNSLKLLEKIDLLQLHKANRNNVVSSDVFKAFDRAERMGIKIFGASVSDIETAIIACKCGRYSYLQFPFNSNDHSLQPVFENLTKYDMKAIINRPFAMGALIDKDGKKSQSEFFHFILSMAFQGVILTGTSSATHLLANVEAFKNASA